MSATAKALMAFHERHVGASVGGDVWMPENVYDKLVELARKELRLAQPSTPSPSAPRAGGSRP